MGLCCCCTGQALRCLLRHWRQGNPVWETRGHLQVLAHVEGEGQSGHGGTCEPHVWAERLPGETNPRERRIPDGIRECKSHTHTHTLLVPSPLRTPEQHNCLIGIKFHLNVTWLSIRIFYVCAPPPPPKLSGCILFAPPPPPPETHV